VHAPDVVGNIRIDQAWGLWQISAAAHEVDGSYNVLNTIAAPPGATALPGAVPTNLSEISGHPETKWGGAVMMALQIKNIPTGPGDDFKIDATWAKGDTKQVISTSATSPNPFVMFGGASGFGSYQSIGFGAVSDAVWLPTFAGGDGTLHLTSAWGVRGAFNHNWDPYWSSSLFGSYSQVHHDGIAKAEICRTFIAARITAPSADFSCNPDFNVAQVGFVTRWTPVKNLTFSAEILYFNLDQKFTGSAVLTPTAPKPTARYDFKDQDTVALNVRVQRNF
jgi:hypothetical protein